MLTFIFCITLVFSLLSHNQTAKSKKLIFFNIAVLFLALMSGLRDPFLYSDNDVYYEYFKGDYLANGEGTINWGYFLINYVILFITPNFQFLCLLMSFVVIYSYSSVIKKYSPYVGLSLLLFFLINYLPSYFLLRQYMAMPFVFLSFKYILERKQKQYLICIILAFSMHSMAISVLPLYYLYSIRYSQRNFFLIIVGAFILCLLFVVIGKFLISFMPTYSNYMESHSEGAAWQRAIMKLYVLLIYIFCLRKNFYAEGVNRLIFFSMLMCIIITVGGANLPGVYRLRDFYSFADFVGVPVILCVSKKMVRKKRIIVLFATAIYVALLFVSYFGFVNSANMENGYRFFWENNEFNYL